LTAFYRPRGSGSGLLNALRRCGAAVRQPGPTDEATRAAGGLTDGAALWDTLGTPVFWRCAGLLVWIVALT